MLVQSSTFVLYLLIIFITLLFVIVNGQVKEECVDLCPESGAGWLSILRPTTVGTTVGLRWEANEGSGGTNYSIQYRLENVNSDPAFNTSFTTADTVADVDTYNITGLLPATRYVVRVCLVEEPDNCGQCILCVMTDCDSVPPTQPTLNGSTISALTVRLTWTSPIGCVTLYNITYASMGQDSSSLLISDPTALTSTVENLSPNTTYQFQIQAVGDFGASPLSNTISLTTLPQSDSPGFLLMSDNNGISYYFTLSTNFEDMGTSETSVGGQLLPAEGITGMSFYPTNSTHGYVYTSSEGNITRHDTVLDKMPPGSIRVTTSNVVMSRAPATVSLITVDWVNDMFYWLEVNDTDAAIMHSLLNGSDVDCVTSVDGVGVTGIEVDPIHGFLYWSVMGAGGGIFQLDLTLAKAASCSSSPVGAVNIVPSYATNGINSMTLNLEDSLIYFAPGSSNLASISLGEKLIANYTHTSVILDARSMASYNEYLAMPSLFPVIYGVFVRIRPPDINAQLLLSSGGVEAITSHMYMIREEFQPLPVPPGPVHNVKYLPTTTSINVTWSPPLYPDNNEYGMSAFSRWTYDVSLDLQGINKVTMDTTYQNTNLMANRAYIIEISPFFPRTLGPVDSISDEFTTSWIVQTVEDVTPMPNVILATSDGTGGAIYTALMSDTQAMPLYVVDEPRNNSARQIVGVAYDVHHNVLYWTTENRGLVQLSLESGGTEPIFLKEDLPGAASIGVDYIGQRLYWIEDGMVSGQSEINYLLLDSTSNDPKRLETGNDITDLAVDSPNGLLFWSHNGATRGISVLRLNGVGGRMMCITDNSQLYRYHAITVDTENKRIFWIKELERSEMAESFQIGVADYDDGSCTNHVNKMISSELSGGRISMTYVAGLLFHTSSASPSTIFIAPSNFSSFSSSDYQLAVGYYNISADAGDINIRSIIANQTSQQFLPVTCEVNKVFGNFKEKNNRKVTFTFSADHPDAIFECKVDNKKFKLCTSPRTLKKKVDAVTVRAFCLVDGKPEFQKRRKFKNKL